MSESKIKNFFSNLKFKKVIWLAPLLYLIHFLEELFGGFWIFLNDYQGANHTALSFTLVNVGIMIAYLVIISVFTKWPNRSTAFIALTWLATAQFFNAFAHLHYTIVYNVYNPGLITAFVLYVPYVPILFWIAYREEYTTKTLAVVSLVLGAIFMTLVHIFIG